MLLFSIQMIHTTSIFVYVLDDEEHSVFFILESFALFN